MIVPRMARVGIMASMSCMRCMPGVVLMLRMFMDVAGVGVGLRFTIVMIVVHVHMHVLVFFHGDFGFKYYNCVFYLVVKLPIISPEVLYNPGRDLQDYRMLRCSIHLAASDGHTSAALLPGRRP